MNNTLTLVSDQAGRRFTIPVTSAPKAANNKVRFELLIGTEVDKNHRRIDPTEAALAVDAVQKRAAQLFGGYSAHELTGGYLHADGQLATEKSLCLWLLTDKPDTEVSPSLDELVFLSKKLLRQESIGLTRTELNYTFV
jgi:hypothetical protein